MPLKYYICPLCEQTRETLRPRVPKCNHDQEEEGEPIPLTEMEEIIVPPGVKMMEVVDEYRGKSRLKDQKKILLERARNHSRDVEGDDLIQRNRNNDIMKINQLNKDGKRRKKIDDI